MPLLLTPKSARNYLQRTGVPLEALLDEKTHAYANEIRAGKWRPGSVLWIRTNGTIVDGLHRCAAVILADKEILCEWVWLRARDRDPPGKMD